MLAGAKWLKVQGIGTVPITVNSVRGKRTFILLDTLYVPEFQTSTVSTWKLEQKEIWWEPQHSRFVHEGKTVFYVDRNLEHCQYIIEFNELSSNTAFTATIRTEPPVAKATADLWHKRLGYLNFEVISYLETAIADAKVIPKDKYHIQPCETCRVSKAKQVISRTPQERAITLFERVHFDIIYLTNTPNQEKYIMYFLDDYTRMHYVYVLYNKAQIFPILRKFVAYIKKQYNFEIRILYFDRETGLVGDDATE